MEKKYFIPLLINGGKEKGNQNFTIINDQITCNKTNWDFYLNPISAFNSLLLLSKESRMKIIPSELHRYFGQKEFLKENKIWIDKNKGINEQNTHYLLQEVTNGTNEWNSESYILIYTVEFKGNFIILNFQSYFRDVKSKINNNYELTLEKTLKLTPEQTFILLANICITYFEIYGFFPKLINVGHINGRNATMGNQMRNIYNFSKKYLKWLEKKLASEEIDPFMILQLNGYKTLSRLLKKKPIQDVSAIQDLIVKTVHIVENNNDASKFELILYYVFYKEGCRNKFFKIIRQWKMRVSENKDIESYVNEIEKNIGSLLIE